MRTNIDYIAARELLLERAEPVGARRVPFDISAGRVLAEEIAAAENVPPFDRSPYDGYAFRAADTADASREKPVTLRILEEIPAGAMWTRRVVPGTAAKLLTGAPIPPGADAVVKFEETEFTVGTVRIFASFAPGDNIVFTGEDVQAGDILAERGAVIDAALLGVLAAQHMLRPLVYDRPRIAVITTGSELAEPSDELTGGRIVDTNRCTFAAELARLGCETETYTCGDDPDEIAAAIRAALEKCDMAISTGGVSVGDYDFTPEAMERAGVEMLVRTLRMKPGGASAYGVRDGKLVCALSGNPASAMTNFYAVVLPALRKQCGFAEPHLTRIPVSLAEDYPKASPRTRIIHGVLDLSDGTARMRVSANQQNGALHSLAGCDLLAEIPAGSGSLPAGTRLCAYLIP